MIAYEELTSNYIVTPVAIETFGPWAPMGLKLIKEEICDLTGKKTELEKEIIIQIIIFIPISNLITK